MKQNLKKVLAIALSAVLCLGLLAGCGSSFSASDLVKGNLDLIYLNQYTDTYLKSVDLTKEEANQQYEDGIALEVSYFINYFSIEADYCDDSIEPQITELYHQIYDYSKYEVGGVSKNGETYLVELTVYPIDIMQKVMEEDLDAFYDQWNARLESGEFGDSLESMSDEQYEAFETAWAQAVIDMVSARVASIDYLDPQTISVQVTKDSSGVYTIDSSDFSRIDGLIISY